MTQQTPRPVPMIDDATWQRMSWHARQQWLLAATALRRRLLEDLEATTRSEAARAAQRQHVHSATLVAAQAILDALGPDPDGHAHLEALERALVNRAPRDRTTAEYRARNAKRQRVLRARRRAERDAAAAAESAA